MPDVLKPNTQYDLSAEEWSGPNGTGDDLGPDTDTTLSYSLTNPLAGDTSTISGSVLTTGAKGGASVIATDGMLSNSANPYVFTISEAAGSLVVSTNPAPVGGGATAGGGTSI